MPSAFTLTLKISDDYKNIIIQVNSNFDIEHKKEIAKVLHYLTTGKLNPQIVFAAKNQASELEGGMKRLMKLVKSWDKLSKRPFINPLQPIGVPQYGE